MRKSICRALARWARGAVRPRSPATWSPATPSSATSPAMDAARSLSGRLPAHSRSQRRRPGDLTGDGDSNDTVLMMLDANGTSPPPRHRAVPRRPGRRADGRAAFLRPEAAGNAAGCPPGAAIGTGVNLNSATGDTDASDLVVHLWDGTSVQNLGRAATAVRLSDTHLAALVSEAGDGAIYNNDGDQNDTVVQVRKLTDTQWTNLAQAADSLDLKGTTVAFLTSESAQGGDSINADGDTTDRVLQVASATNGKITLGRNTTPRAMAAEEFVLGERRRHCLRQAPAGRVPRLGDRRGGRQPQHGRHRHVGRRPLRLRCGHRRAVQHRPGGDAVHARGLRSAPALPRLGQQGDVPDLRARSGCEPGSERRGESQRSRPAGVRRVRRPGHAGEPGRPDGEEPEPYRRHR